MAPAASSPTGASAASVPVAPLVGGTLHHHAGQCSTEHVRVPTRPADSFAAVARRGYSRVGFDQVLGASAAPAWVRAPSLRGSGLGLAAPGGRPKAAVTCYLLRYGADRGRLPG